MQIGLKDEAAPYVESSEIGLIETFFRLELIAETSLFDYLLEEY
jgi:hypothetical protein